MKICIYIILFLFQCRAVRIKDESEFTVQKGEMTSKPVLFEYAIKRYPPFSNESKDIDDIPGNSAKTVGNVFRNILEEKLLEYRNFKEYAIVKERNSAMYKGLYDYKVKINISFSQGFSFYYIPALLSLSMIPAKAFYSDYEAEIKIFGRDDSLLKKYRFEEEVSYWYAIYYFGLAGDHLNSVNAFQYIIDKILFKIQEDRIIR
ncbi:MAG TPA: hypothetical protein PL048_00445 [Leptospiraceae bacterium]|nr:hypothetical protein [Leptospiraceae bacterium]HMY70033.1 hypothetical protein [Leptospiraceae bacterium]HMZ57211.1 hypothetical protein [Leptospiraceae bacterium]HNF13103.1 hypothetical protein [Leptospiraceae bacterium]HNF25324.1 hypothetical protein [Leptospiraceae bacterium]